MLRSFVSKIHRLAPVLLVSPLAALAPALTLAQGLPTIEDPSRGPGDGIIDTIQNYSYDIVMLVALLVIATMFTGVCYHAYTTYAEIHSGGRKTWGEFGLTVIVGAVLLVIAIWLLTSATEIL
jgi:integrating conjugative element membrane protein (TIGR03745 family)